MRIKTILAGAALILAATIGSASAAEQFSTLEGITVEVLTTQEMGIVVGTAINLAGLGSPPGDPGVGPFASTPLSDWTDGTPIDCSPCNISF